MKSPRPTRMVAPIVLSCVLVMLPGTWYSAPSVVELAHLPSGLALWQDHSFGMYRVCGPVSKFLYAAPAYVAGVRAEYPAEFDLDTLSRREWDLGKIFQMNNYYNYMKIYRFSRIIPMIVTACAGLLIFEWSARLFGARAGLLALGSWCWTPYVLGHGSLVTSDMMAAFMAVLAARAFFAYLLSPTPLRAICAGSALGIAVATKYTLLVLVPCWAALVAGRLYQLRSRPLPGPGIRVDGRRMLPSSVALGTAAFLLAVNACYGFQGFGFRLSECLTGQTSLTSQLRLLAGSRATSWLLELPLPLPIEFLRGLLFQMADCEKLQATYLLGESRIGGWWYWYVVALLLKLPLPFLALLGLSFAGPLSRPAGDDAQFWGRLCLLLPAAEILISISALTGTGTNAALRYLLPTFALLCVWVASVASSHPGFLGRPSGCYLALMGGIALSGIPDHLSWHNAIGRALSLERPALLGDSLDWGQDAYRLGRWVKAHAREGKTVVCVYGLGDGRAFGLEYPESLSACGPWDGAAYVAVSVDIQFGYEAFNCITIDNAQCLVERDVRRALQGCDQVDGVGRTIRIYRARDVAGRIRRTAAPPTAPGDEARLK